MSRTSSFLLLVVLVVAVHLGGALAKTASTAGTHPDCVDGRFQCWNFHNIPCMWTCDGMTDCQPLGEDEVGCTTGSLVIQDHNQDDIDYMKPRDNDFGRFREEISGNFRPTYYQGQWRHRRQGRGRDRHANHPLQLFRLDHVDRELHD